MISLQHAMEKHSLNLTGPWQLPRLPSPLGGPGAMENNFGLVWYSTCFIREWEDFANSMAAEAEKQAVFQGSSKRNI